LWRVIRQQKDAMAWAGAALAGEHRLKRHTSTAAVATTRQQH